MEPHIDGNEGPGRPHLLREPILICSGSAGHLRVRRLPGHCLPQNEFLQGGRSAGAEQLFFTKRLHRMAGRGNPCIV